MTEHKLETPNSEEVQGDGDDGSESVVVIGTLPDLRQK